MLAFALAAALFGSADQFKVVGYSSGRTSVSDPSNGGDTYDVRVPAAESYAFFHAAGHRTLPRRSVRRADVYRRWLDWLDRYLK